MWLYQYFRQIIRAAVFQQIGDERHPRYEASVSRHPEFAPRPVAVFALLAALAFCSSEDAPHPVSSLLTRQLISNDHGLRQVGFHRPTCAGMWLFVSRIIFGNAFCSHASNGRQ